MSRDRDRILEQALKHELRAVGTPPAGACLDAETLGAWTDGGLDPAAMAAAEAHLASCARCQAMVGTFARSAPTIEAAGSTGTVSLWKWWLAPIAAGVAATTLWMVVPEQQQVAVAPPVAKDAAVPETNAVVATPRSRSLPEPVPSTPAAPAVAAERFSARDNLSADSRADSAQNKMREERKEEPPARQQQERGADAVAAAPPAPAAPAPPPPAMAPPAAVALGRAAEIGALQKRERLQDGVIEIATLDPALGWRIVGDRIERSDNAGKTWTVKRQNPGDGIVAGSAPSNAVGWFVGRAGRVLLTTDSGATFADVSLAEPLDLASVAAIDARNASIFSVVGRRFRTDDGGRTWRPF